MMKCLAFHRLVSLFVRLAARRTAQLKVFISVFHRVDRGRDVCDDQSQAVICQVSAATVSGNHGGKRSDATTGCRDRAKICAKSPMADEPWQTSRLAANHLDFAEIISFLANVRVIHTTDRIHHFSRRIDDRIKFQSLLNPGPSVK
jgi:hypothetical protein